MSLLCDQVTTRSFTSPLAVLRLVLPRGLSVLAVVRPTACVLLSSSLRPYASASVFFFSFFLIPPIIRKALRTSALSDLATLKNPPWRMALFVIVIFEGH
ncbi:hypothetical protein JMJ77_0011140 [Colletotrichum scovillei]|uniref:Uncharacterized protein n=1 Tax=Colletotrichum scovillei TaxID=1209932 RepID=A0A9P7UAV2_9PEZI|nr:hypothetical protein JMJ77_0011140 [Colletotrichum scovillei]KAG7060117.1 hypothetical protein JMJ78_0015396 [Colletotrichum scovillei]KAG7067565.1 hypothetical protein JMJ76_0008997 [Colletotrichum scovillei]